MRKLMEDTREYIKEFVAQRDDLALLLMCEDSEAIMVHKIVESIQEEGLSEMFWIFTQDFTDAWSYADALTSTFASTHGAVSLSQTQQGLDPWPPLPDSILDPSEAPEDRLRHLVQFSRTLLPDPAGMLAVWCLLPLSVTDAEAYAGLLAQVLHHDFPVPWCHHIRFVVRGLHEDSPMGERLDSIPRIRWHDPGLGREEIQAAVDEEANDPSVPLEQRLQNVLVSAHLDHAEQRFDDALAKFSILLKYYIGTRNGAMVALILSGMGEVHLRSGSPEQAGRCFEAALEPASGAPGPPVPILLNLTLGLGNLRLSAARWEEAEAYYDAAQQFATLQRAPDTKLRAIENLGVCQYQQRKVSDALDSWKAGAVVAKALDLPELEQAFLNRLRAHFEDTSDPAGWQAVEQDLLRMKATGTTTYDVNHAGA
jgi:tetratricopeptide (TPR) repeat protein